MKSEDEGRTEEPSEGLRTRARKEGLSARSADFTQAAGMLAGMAVLVLGAPSALRETVLMFGSFWGGMPASSLASSMTGTGSVTAAANEVLRAAFGLGLNHFLRIAALPLGAIVAGVLAAGLVQTGFRLFPSALKPDFRRLGHGGRPGRSGDGSGPGRFYEILRPVVRSAAVIVAAAAILFSGLGRIVSGAGSPPAEAFSGIMAVAGQCALACGFVLLVTGAADWLYRRSLLFDSLMLTPAQLREEKRREEGDPAYRAAVRSRMKEIVASRAIGKKGEGEIR